MHELGMEVRGQRCRVTSLPLLILGFPGSTSGLQDCTAKHLDLLSRLVSPQFHLIYSLGNN